MKQSTLYLSRVHLRPDAPASALRAVLVPDGESARTAASHHLIWTLFGDRPDRTRDFLWREAEPGLFYTLSERKPNDQHGLFRVDEPKAFEPELRAGDRLAFALRVNATVARGRGDGQRGKPCDVVMDALKAVPPAERATVRPTLLTDAARTWMDARAERCGFALDAGTGALGVTAYRVMRIQRGRRVPPLSVGVLDLEGVLEVRDPGALVQSIARGFGRAKAFGCGLMLVRRVAPA